MMARCWSILSRLALAAIAGVVTTVGTAWYPAATGAGTLRPVHDLPSQGPEVRDAILDRTHTGSLSRSDGRMVTRLDVFSPTYIMVCGNAYTPESEAEAKRLARSAPRWDQLTPGWAMPLVEPVLRRARQVGSLPIDYAVVIEAYGWPMRAAYFEDVTDFTTTPMSRTLVGGLRPKSDSKTAQFSGRGNGVVLPCRPIWRGLVVDGGVFAMGWLGLLFVPRGIRVWMRRRGNRCGGCGYSMAGLEVGARCPECGGCGEAILARASGS